MIMRYINSSLYKNKDESETDFVVSNIFKLSDSEL